MSSCSMRVNGAIGYLERQFILISHDQMLRTFDTVDSFPGTEVMTGVKRCAESSKTDLHLYQSKSH
jgi:hypothetical protein